MSPGLVNLFFLSFSGGGAGFCGDSSFDGNVAPYKGRSLESDKVVMGFKNFGVTDSRLFSTTMHTLFLSTEHV